MSNFVKAQTGQLSNGMGVSYLHLPNVRKVNVIVEVPVGAVHDPEGQEGISHILEHTVFCGTKTLPEELFERKLMELGDGNSNASTGTDKTTFDIWASAQDPKNFSEVAELMRQILTEPALPSKRVEIEKNVILNERADGVDNLKRHVPEQLTHGSHAGKGRSPDVMGSIESIKSVSADGLRQFMQDNYDVQYMHIYAAGPLGFTEAMNELERTLGTIPSSGLSLKSPYQIEVKATDERVLADRLQNYTAMFFVRPAVGSLREVLIYEETSKHLADLLPKVLRREQGCFYSPQIGTWNTSETNYINFISISSTPDDTEAATVGVANFGARIDELLPDHVIRSSLSSSAYEISDVDSLTVNSLNHVIGQRRSIGVDFDSEETVRTYNEIDPEEVRDEARRIISSLTAMHVQGPEPDRAPSLEHLQKLATRGQARELSAKSAFIGPQLMP